MKTTTSRSKIHYGGFAGPLLCNGSEGGYTTKRKKLVTCQRCQGIIRKEERRGFKAVSGMFVKSCGHPAYDDCQCHRDAEW